MPIAERAALLSDPRMVNQVFLSWATEGEVKGSERTALLEKAVDVARARLRRGAGAHAGSASGPPDVAREKRADVARNAVRPDVTGREEGRRGRGRKGAERPGEDPVKPGK